MNEWMNDWMAEWKTEGMKEWCLSCLPAISAVASATQWFSSRSCYNAFSNLQLQSRIAAAWHYHSCYAARSRANAFCPSRLQTRIAGEPHQIDQNLCSVNSGLFRAAPNMPVFLIFIWNRDLALVWRTFFQSDLPNVPVFYHLELQTELSP